MTPPLDIPAAIGEAEQLAPRTRELEAQRNEFARAQLLESLGIQVPGYQEAQAKRAENALALLRGELPPDVAAQVQRQAAGRAVSGGFAGSQAARNLTARDLGRTSLALQQAGGQQFANILGTTPLAPVANYEFAPQDVARLRESERIARMNALIGVASKVMVLRQDSPSASFNRSTGLSLLSLVSRYETPTLAPTSAFCSLQTPVITQARITPLM